MIKIYLQHIPSTKICFINEVAVLSQRVGADIKAGAKGMELDWRIGNKIFLAGSGYSGYVRVDW